MIPTFKGFDPKIAEDMAHVLRRDLDISGIFVIVPPPLPEQRSAVFLMKASEPQISRFGPRLARKILSKVKSKMQAAA